MILAAGFGTRMRPFTDHSAKPLVPVNGIPLICYTLAWLKKNRVHDVAINLHHHGEKIVALLGNGEKIGMKIRYSHEKEILGTGGGIKKALRYLDRKFLLVNGDIIFDFDLKDMIRHHEKTSQAMATLLVRKVPDAGKFGVIGVKRDLVRAILGVPVNPGTVSKTMYAGVHVFDGEHLKLAMRKHAKGKKKFCIIRDVEMPFLKQGGVLLAHRHRGFWRVNDSLEDVALTERLIQKRRLSYQSEMLQITSALCLK